MPLSKAKAAAFRTFAAGSKNPQFPSYHVGRGTILSWAGVARRVSAECQSLTSRTLPAVDLL